VDQLSALGLAITVSVVFSTLVTVVMTKPLRGVLRQLCLDSNASASSLFGGSAALLVVGYQISRARPAR
jgi:hypothetical protein